MVRGIFITTKKLVWFNLVGHTTVALTEWNLSHRVQGELCEDHLYQKEYWEVPTWTT